MANEIDDMLVDGRWRMIQNCMVYRSAQFLNTDHRLVVATLKLQLKSRRMGPSQPRLDVGKLNDERVAEEFANKLSGDLQGLGELLKAGENAVLISLHAVLCSAWNIGIIPTDWKRGLVVPFWKGNGDCQDCNNYGGVTLPCARQGLC